MTCLRALSLIIIGFLSAFSAAADIVDRPSFKVTGVVIVWNGSPEGVQSTPQIARAGTAVQTRLDYKPVQTALLTPHPPVNTVPLNAKSANAKSFYVASNTAFNIDAELTDAHKYSAETLKSASFTLSLQENGTDNLAYGSKAQPPHSGGTMSGFVQKIVNLAEIQTRRTVFQGNQKTARSPGTISEQSVKFSVDYQKPTGRLTPPLANITFTVYVP